MTKREREKYLRDTQKTNKLLLQARDTIQKIADQRNNWKRRAELLEVEIARYKAVYGEVKLRA